MIQPQVTEYKGFLTTAKSEGTRKHSSLVFRGSVAFLTPWFWIPNLQNFEKIYFFCFKITKFVKVLVTVVQEG